MNAPATNIAALRGSAPPKKGMAEILKLPKPKQLPAMLDAFQIEIKRALPSHLNADRISRIALTAFRRVPKLASCEPASVFAAIIQSAQLGLEIDTLGRAYLVPYGNECQFIPGWKGLVELVHRAKEASVWTGAVFQGDQFEYSLGDSPFVRHKPSGESDPKKLTYVYAVGRPKGSEWPIIEVWTLSRIERHRDRYNKVGKRHYSFENVEMYARKVVLLQVLKYLPMSPELEKAVTMNDDAEVGKQHLSLNDAIDGEYEAITTEGADHGEDGGGEGGGTEGAPVETGDAPKTDNGGAQVKQSEPEVAQTDKPRTTRTRANIE